MKFSAPLFAGLFFAAAIANLWAEFSDSEWGIYASKPLLMIFLGLYFVTATRIKTRFSRLILAGIAFSLAGDILLMFNAPDSPHFFLPGLVSFLFAHVCYILAFLGYSRNTGSIFRQHPLLIAPFLIFLAGFLAYLWPGIPEALKIPVSVYSTVIVAMSMSCFQLRPQLDRRIFYRLFGGVLLFVISDSLIALSKFNPGEGAIPYVRPLIMLTYLMAQYLIASNAVKIDKP